MPDCYSNPWVLLAIFLAGVALSYLVMAGRLRLLFAHYQVAKKEELRLAEEVARANEAVEAANAAVREARNVG